MRLIAYGNGHYTRQRADYWVYTLTGDRVPGAKDLRVGGRIVMTAPELHPDLLLNSDQVAELYSVKPESWRRMVSRSRDPLPVFRFGNVPLWTRPVLELWHERRPGRGRTAA